MMRKHGILPTPTVRDHHGDLHAEVGDICQPLGELHRILSECNEEKRTCGATEAMLIQVEIAIAELQDFRRKFQKTGFRPQTQIDTTPLPLRHEPAAWARGLKRFNGRVS